MLGHSWRLIDTLGGHTASVNVVKWGGGGIGGKGVLYTASSDRTARVWDANGVSTVAAPSLSLINNLIYSSCGFFAGQTFTRAQGPCTLGDNARFKH